MGEKREFICRGGVIYYGSYGYHSMASACLKLNSQSSEIAGLRETVEVLTDWIKSTNRVDHEMDIPNVCLTQSRVALAKRRLKALGVEVPDAAKGEKF